MRRFKLDFLMYGEYVDSAIIALHQSVIDAVDDEWRSQLYDLNTPEEIAEHIGFNLIIRGSRLSMLDGWANMSDEYAQVIDMPVLDDWEIEAIEVNEDTRL